MLGTIGWIVAGLSLSWLGWETGVNMFYLTAASGILLGLYSLTLPHTPPIKDANVSLGQIFGLDALALLAKPSYLIFMLSSFLICIPLSFYYQITSRIVEMTGSANRTNIVADSSPMAFRKRRACLLQARLWLVGNADDSAK